MARRSSADRLLVRIGAVSTLTLSACGSGGSDPSVPSTALASIKTPLDAQPPLVDAAAPEDAALVEGAAESSSPNRYITRVVSFTPGPGAGFGASRMPDVVYGPPVPGDGCRGSTDVVALGTGGEIVVEMGTEIIDGPGPDLLVFENPFYIGCDPAKGVYAEPGEISVSDDGSVWATFPCASTSPPYGWCAGWRPDGDPFDLADVGLLRARFVRVRDIGSGVDASGFDLDAVAVLNAP